MFLESNSESQEHKETERGQETSEIEMALLLCPQKERHMSEAKLLKLISGGKRHGGDLISRRQSQGSEQLL